MGQIDSRGFTLTEVLVCLLIISIVSMTIVPGIDAALDKAAGDAAVRELVTDLRYAQQMALAEGRVYYVTFNKAMQLYQISVAGHPAQVIIKQVIFGDGLSLLGTTFTSNRVHFNSLGAPSAGGTIEMLDWRGREVRITILPATGRVRVYR